MQIPKIIANGTIEIPLTISMGVPKKVNTSFADHQPNCEDSITPNTKNNRPSEERRTPTQSIVGFSLVSRDSLIISEPISGDVNGLLLLVFGEPLPPALLL